MHTLQHQISAPCKPYPRVFHGNSASKACPPNKCNVQRAFAHVCVSELIMQNWKLPAPHVFRNVQPDAQGVLLSNESEVFAWINVRVHIYIADLCGQIRTGKKTLIARFEDIHHTRVCVRICGCTMRSFSTCADFDGNSTEENACIHSWVGLNQGMVLESCWRWGKHFSKSSENV